MTTKDQSWLPDEKLADAELAPWKNNTFGYPS